MTETQLATLSSWDRNDFTADDIQAIDTQTREWHGSLPVFAVPNKRLPIVQAVLLGEVAESIVEREREGTKLYKPYDNQKETLDIAVPAHAFAMRRGAELDLIEIRRRMNGHGQSSKIYEKIAETIGNLPETKGALTRDLQWLLTQVYSAMWHLPEIASPAEIIKPKMAENFKNYPSIYFDVYDSETGRLLSADEQEAKYDHSVKCMRLIRKTLNRPGGLLWSDHAPHARLILDFRHAASNYQTLAEAMQQIKKLTVQAT